MADAPRAAGDRHSTPRSEMAWRTCLYGTGQTGVAWNRVRYRPAMWRRAIRLRWRCRCSYGRNSGGFGVLGEVSTCVRSPPGPRPRRWTASVRPGDLPRPQHRRTRHQPTQTTPCRGHPVRQTRHPLPGDHSHRRHQPMAPPRMTAGAGHQTHCRAFRYRPSSAPPSHGFRGNPASSQATASSAQ